METVEVFGKEISSTQTAGEQTVLGKAKARIQRVETIGGVRRRAFNTEIAVLNSEKGDTETTEYLGSIGRGESSMERVEALETTGKGEGGIRKTEILGTTVRMKGIMGKKKGGIGRRGTLRSIGQAGGSIERMEAIKYIGKGKRGIERMEALGHIESRKGSI